MRKRSTVYKNRSPVTGAEGCAVYLLRVSLVIFAGVCALAVIVILSLVIW